MKEITAEDLRIELAKNPKVRVVDIIKHLKFKPSSKTYLSRVLNDEYGASQTQMQKLLKAIKDIRLSKQLF